MIRNRRQNGGRERLRSSYIGSARDRNAVRALVAPLLANRGSRDPRCIDSPSPHHRETVPSGQQATALRTEYAHTRTHPSLCPMNTMHMRYPSAATVAPPLLLSCSSFGAPICCARARLSRYLNCHRIRCVGVPATVTGLVFPDFDAVAGRHRTCSILSTYDKNRRNQTTTIFRFFVWPKYRNELPTVTSVGRLFPVYMSSFANRLVSSSSSVHSSLTTNIFPF